ncbi:MAG: ABC transporter substrate-binding protein [Microbacterium sp.]
MFRWKATAAAAIAITALALTGCSGDSGSESESGGTLTLVAIASPTTLDPSGGEWGNRSVFYQSAYDTLLLADTDGSIQPFLATDWSYNDDNTVLTLNLRDDVTFTDGSSLTGDVVVANLERFKAGTSPDANYFDNVSTVEATGEHQVTITLSAPDPALLSYLTRDAGLIASGDAISGGVDLATEMVGSGPYVYDAADSVSGTTYTYTKNPDYWNPDLQHYDKVVVNVLTDTTAALNAIKAGEANGVKIGDNTQISEIEAAGWTINENELDFQGLLLLDRDGTMNSALADVRVRQAINMAFDRDALLQTLADGYGTVTEQVFPTSSAAYDESLDSYYSYDPEGAKELLAEAGYPDGFTLDMPTSSYFGTAGPTLIAQQLADIGITVNYTDAGNNFIADLIAPKYAASFMALEQNPDWQLIQFMISPTATFNPFHTTTSEVADLITTIQYGDEATQDEAAAELNRYLVENAWFAPFYRVSGPVATDANTTVTMLPTNAFPNIYDFQPVA